MPLYSELSGLDNDITLIKNGSIGYSIITTIIPNKTILDGIGGTNVNIRQPVSCSLLLNNNDTPYEALGFKKENTEIKLDIGNVLLNYKNLRTNQLLGLTNVFNQKFQTGFSNL